MSRCQSSAQAARGAAKGFCHGQVHVARHLAEAGRLGRKIAARQRRVGGVFGTGVAVEISQRGEGECPAVGPPGEVLLAEGQIAPVVAASARAGARCGRTLCWPELR